MTTRPKLHRLTPVRLPSCDFIVLHKTTILLILLFVSPSCKKGAPTPSTGTRDVTRFVSIYLGSRTEALGIYKKDDADPLRYRLSETLVSSLDNHLPDFLALAEVKHHLVCKVVSETPEVLVVRRSEIPSSGLVAMPIVEKGAVYFCSQSPQPSFLLTVPIAELISYLHQRHGGSTTGVKPFR
jgi:hypothetical protein